MADLAVVGLGYVGLPLSVTASLAGLDVVGLEVNDAVADDLNAGRSHVQDVPRDELASALAGGFRVTTDEAVLGAARTVVVCVPTPLRADGVPDLSAVIAANEAIARWLRPGMLVVLESTTYPGTTDEVVRPILEASGLTAGRDFALAFSPERVDPGNPHFGLRNTPKVVGGLTPSCTSTAAAFYGKFVERVVHAKGAREAEMAKLLENTYRHVNIALVNEMSVFCHDLGIDLWDAIDCAATKPFGFQAFRPGPGVGGHCIPIDPNYLSYKVRTLGYPFRFVELAQEVNARMPAYVVARAVALLNRHRKAMNGSRVLLVGVTYKANVSDLRESPAVPVAQRLLALGATVEYADPLAPAWQVDGRAIPRVADLDAALQTADLTILLQDHAGYDVANIAARAPLLLDTRGRTNAPTAERL